VYSWLVGKSCDECVDLLVLAGDLLGCPEGYGTVEDSQRHDAATIVKILQETRIPIYYIMGNDDLVEFNPPSDQFTSLHGRRMDLGGVNFVGYQYSLPFMGGVYEKREEGIRDDLDQLARLVDSETVLVTHNPAYGVLDIGITDVHAGSQAILELVRGRNVRAHLHGHIHEQFGREGRHFNVASSGRQRAMIIDLDTMTVTVEQGSANAT
jgi:Icc-related predicted phosphoesterase